MLVDDFILVSDSAHGAAVSGVTDPRGPSEQQEQLFVSFTQKLFFIYFIHSSISIALLIVHRTVHLLWIGSIVVSSLLQIGSLPIAHVSLIFYCEIRAKKRMNLGLFSWGLLYHRISY